MPQAFDRYLSDIVAVNINMAFLNVVETADQIDNSGFAGSCGADQRKVSPGLMWKLT